MIGEVYFEGYGCPTNEYDLEVIASRFEARGYRKVIDPSNAEVVVVNTCAVKKRTEDRVLSRLRLFEKMGKSVVVSGCLSVVDPAGVAKAVPSYVAMLGPSSVERIEEVLSQGFGSRGMNLTTGIREPKVGKVAPSAGSVIQVVPVCEGCLGECSFCCTRLARGRLISGPPETIVKAIESGVARNVREFWLTGQDVGAYGLDIGSDLFTLLSSICSVEGDFRLRVGMINPEWCKENLEELIDAFRCPKVFKFIHIPLQSGNDSVLSDMRRKYTVRDFVETVESFRREYPWITLWTDIICGYPTEDEDAFNDTLNLLRQVKPDVVNISKFSARTGTLAQGLRPIPSEEVKERSREASRLCKSISLSRNTRWLGWSGKVLADEKGRDGTIIGRSESYKPVAFPAPEDLLGQDVRVVIVGARCTHLIGRHAD